MQWAESMRCIQDTSFKKTNYWQSGHQNNSRLDPFTPLPFTPLPILRIPPNEMKLKNDV